MRLRTLLICALVAVCGGGVSASAQGAGATLEGQVVCSVCWFEADRTTVAFGTAADLECEIDCAAKNVPAALAVGDPAAKDFRLYLLEDGKFKRPEKNWLKYMASRVRVSGATRERGGKHYLKVDALEVLAPPPAAEEATQQAEAGEAELALRDLTGAEQRLSALRGRVVVLNFWATWCVPCRKEMPDLALIQNEYAPYGVQVVGAAADAPEERARVLQFVRETKVNFPVWLGATTEDMRRLGLGTALPATAIVGRDGRVVARIRGVVEASDLRRRLDALMKEATAGEEGKAGASVGAGREEAARARRPRDVSSVPS